MPKKPFWETAEKASIHTPEPLISHLQAVGKASSSNNACRGQKTARHTQPSATRATKNLSFSENLSALYELWNAQRHELEASSEPLPKRIEALGRLARVLPQLQVAERLHKAKRGEKAIDEMSDEELLQMLSKETKESSE